MADDGNSGRRRVLRGALGWALGFAAARASGAPRCEATPPQTPGPFFPVGTAADTDVDLTRVAGRAGSARGERIRVQGRVLDARCRPVAGARVHLWQADANGRYRHPADPNPAQPDPDFQGFGELATGRDGRYGFLTIKPAPYPLAFLDGGRADTRAGLRTPHLHFRVAARGFAELSTQMYFAGERLNASDLILGAVPAARRAAVVIEAARDGRDGTPLFRFDLVLARA